MKIGNAAAVVVAAGFGVGFEMAEMVGSLAC